jgi:DNA-binding transcriptional ArsR family regulator
MKTVIEIPFSLDSLLLKEAALEIRGINHKLRKQIVQVIHKKGRISAHEICTTMKVPQVIVAQHLAILRKHRYVVIQVDYTHVFYTVNYSRIKDVEEISRKLLHKGFKQIRIRSSVQ